MNLKYAFDLDDSNHIQRWSAQRAFSQMLRLCGAVCGAYELAQIASAKLTEY